MADDAVGARVDERAERRHDVRRRERHVLEPAMRNDDDDTAARLQPPDDGRGAGEVPPEHAGAVARRREVLALADVDDVDGLAIDAHTERRAGIRLVQACPDGPDAALPEHSEALAKPRDAIVEDVVVGEASDLERNRRQPGRMCGFALEDRAALPYRLRGRCQRALAVDDAEIGVAQNGQQVAVDGLRVGPHDRVERADGGPIR